MSKFLPMCFHTCCSMCRSPLLPTSLLFKELSGYSIHPKSFTEDWLDWDVTSVVEIIPIFLCGQYLQLIIEELQ